MRQIYKTIVVNLLRIAMVAIAEELAQQQPATVAHDAAGMDALAVALRAGGGQGA